MSETGATVFISSHLVHELERFCDWIGVVDGGRMVTEMPMETLKKEIKRVRVVGMPEELGKDVPFQLIGRRPSDGMGAGETWVVRGWRDDMREFFSGAGATVKEIAHLDLEESFVELLSSARPEIWMGRNGGGPGGAAKVDAADDSAVAAPKGEV